MDSARRRQRNLIQNITIAVLSVTAVLLFAWLQMYNLEGSDGQGYLEQLVGGVPDSQSPTELSAFSAPVRVVVTDSYGRFGSLGLSTDSETFSTLGRRLVEALGSVERLTASTEAEFLAALSGTSVYYDFLSPLPLEVLTGLLGESLTNLQASARCLILAAEGDQGGRLYLWDGEETYFSAPIPGTVVSADALSDLATQPGLVSISFALDSLDSEAAGQLLSPLSLLPAELPSPPVLSASSPVSTRTDWLLSAFGFNINANNWYMDSLTGATVVVEGDRSLRIYPDGTVSYQGGAEPSMEIAAQGETPTAAEAVLGVSILLDQLAGDLTGEAALYVESVSQSEGSTVLRFGCHAGGIPIRYTDGAPAAEVTLSGTSVTELTIRFRQYTSTGESSLLLPLRQALAILADSPGSQLSMGYVDSGGETVPASWLAE